jgi:hypothetical protein
MPVYPKIKRGKTSYGFDGKVREFLTQAIPRTSHPTI